MFRLAEGWVGRYRPQGTAPGEDGVRYSLAFLRMLGPFLVAGRTLPVLGWALDLDRGLALRWRVRLGRQRVVATSVPRPDLVAAFAGTVALPTLCGGEAMMPARLGPSVLQVDVETGPDRWRTVYRALVLGLGAASQAGDGRPDDRFGGSGRPLGLSGISSLRVTVLLVGDVLAAVETTLASLRAQTHGGWSVILVGATAAAGYAETAPDFATALATVADDYVMPLRAGDRLRADALEMLLAQVAHAPETDLVYADEEAEFADATLPFFKPGWSPDTLEAHDCIGAPALFRASVARGLPARSAYDLALMFTEAPRRIAHVGQVLCSRATSALRPNDEDERLALTGRLARTGRSGQVVRVLPPFAAHDCRVALPEPSRLVSVVIPTAGRDLDLDGRRIDLVVDCVRGIKERSTYASMELVVVANPDLPAAKAEALRALGCRLLVYDEPVFNVAKKLNMGVAAASGDFVLLLNDDVEVVAADWIERLVAQASKPHVGVVGGKLLYPDGTLQHAGIVLVDGNPQHVRRFYPGTDLGYFFSTCSPRNYLAVTGACMMSRIDVFRHVGGYTESFPVNFNDVDYCLKVRALGLHVVYEPGCELIHYESVSRTASVASDEYGRFRRRWGSEYPSDPFYDAAAFGFRPPAYDISRTAEARSAFVQTAR